MNIHTSEFTAFLGLGLSPSGIDVAEKMVLPTGPHIQQQLLIKWLFANMRGAAKGEAPQAALTPADELYLKELLLFMAEVNAATDSYKPKRIHHVSTQFDFLHFTRNDQQWSPLKKINFFYRSNFPPVKNAAVVTTVRNEAVNIVEWIAHHRAFGFEDFFFYVNDSDDGTIELLENLAFHGICHIIKNTTNLGKPGGDTFPIQSKCLEHAIHFLRPLREFKWALFCDVDEFLITKAVTDPVPFKRPLNDLIWKLDNHPDEPKGVLFNWKWFGSNAAYAREPGLNFERFKNFVKASHVKTFAKINRCLAFPTSHHPHLLHGAQFLDGALNVTPHANFEMPTTYEFGQINHYWNKSFQEYVAKHLRGKGFRGFGDFFEYGNNRFYGKFEEMSAKWIDRVKQEIDFLESLPNVATMQQSAEESLSQIIAKYDKENDLSDLYISSKFEIDKASDLEIARSPLAPADSFCHVIASPMLHPRQPLLVGTERFAAPWLKYWHEQSPSPVNEVSCRALMGAIASKGGALWHNGSPFSFSGIESPDQNLRLDDSLPQRSIFYPCIVLTGYHGGKYGRSISDWMLRVGIVHHLVKSINLPFRILLDNAAPSWMYKILQDFWGITPDNIEIFDPESERIFLWHALVPTTSIGVGSIHPHLNQLIEEMAKIPKVFSTAPTTRRIFLTQQFVGEQEKRQCCNENELVEYSHQRHGFVPVSIDKLSWVNQIKLFCEAEIIVNNTGSPITGAIFCKPQTRFASIGCPTLLLSELGTLRGWHNAYYTLNTETTSRYNVTTSVFSEFLDALCS